MRNTHCSWRESYAAKSYTQMSRYLHMSHTDKNIIYIYTTSRVKEEWKYRVLHIIGRFYCVSGKAMFRTTDSNGLNSFTMTQARTCSMNRKWQVLGFPKLRTVSQFLSVSLEDILPKGKQWLGLLSRWGRLI